MNERINELAEQAFMVCLKGADEKHLEQLERFAELVRQDLYQEIGKSVITQIQAATKMEREACAKLFDAEVWSYDYREIAAAIRGRTE